MVDHAVNHGAGRHAVLALDRAKTRNGIFFRGRARLRSDIGRKLHGRELLPATGLNCSISAAAAALENNWHPAAHFPGRTFLHRDQLRLSRACRSASLRNDRSNSGNIYSCSIALQQVNVRRA